MSKARNRKSGKEIQEGGKDRQKGRKNTSAKE